MPSISMQKDGTGRVGPFLALALFMAACQPAPAAEAPDGEATMVAAEDPGFISEILADLADAESKVVGLAEALTEEQYAWRPGEGVRSAGEVYMHIAVDNYLIPAASGMMPPTSVDIDVNDYATVQAYETRPASKAEIVADLRASFAHLRAAVEATADDLTASASMFGMETTNRGLWIVTATHLHEHLGQSIAYARTNGVVPPWSQAP